MQDKSNIIDKTTVWNLQQGWFDFIFVMPFAKLIIFFESLFGISLSIVLISVILNFMFLPLTILNKLELKRKRELQPMVLDIKKEYGENISKEQKKERKQRIKKLYKQNGYKSIYSRLLWLRLPFLIGVWQAIQRMSSIKGAVFLNLNLSQQPMEMILSGYYQYLVLIIILGVSVLVSNYTKNILAFLLKKTELQKINSTALLINIYLMIFIVKFALSLPSAMNIYMITNYIVRIISTGYLYLKYNL